MDTLCDQTFVNITSSMKYKHDPLFSTSCGKSALETNQCSASALSFIKLLSYINDMPVLPIGSLILATKYHQYWKSTNSHNSNNKEDEN